MAQVAKLQAKNAELQAKNAELQAKNAELQAQIVRLSSAMTPTQDIDGAAINFIDAMKKDLGPDFHPPRLDLQAMVLIMWFRNIFNTVTNVADPTHPGLLKQLILDTAGAIIAENPDWRDKVTWEPLLTHEVVMLHGQPFNQSSLLTAWEGQLKYLDPLTNLVVATQEQYPNPKSC